MQTKLNQLLVFPCAFTFKIMGRAKKTLLSQVVSVVQSYKPGNYSPIIKRSSKGNYYSISITIQANNSNEIESLYKAISAIDDVKIVL